MKQILLHANTFARIAGRLKAFEGQVQPIVMEETGETHRPWGGEGDAHIVYGNTDVWFGEAVQQFLQAVMQSERLDWFQSSAAGIEHPVLQMIRQKASYYTTNHTQAEAMSEWALWQALDYFRQGRARQADRAAKDYRRRDSLEINGSRWLIIGFGSIGGAVGRRVCALGGHVTGLRRSGGTSPDADAVVTPDCLTDELGKADVVLLCAPHTDETENMVDAAFLSAMQPHALLLNLGRGKLVDEAALVAALDKGCPAFAALDVQVEEPLPDNSPLWTHPKIMLTPHDSADTEGSSHRSDDTFLDNLERYLKGQPLKHVVTC